MNKYFISSFFLSCDLFLFFTGNMSFISYFLGSFYFVHFILVQYLLVMGFIYAREKSKKNAIFFLLFFINIFLLMNYFSEDMKNNSKAKLNKIAIDIVNGNKKDIIFNKKIKNRLTFNIKSIVFEDYFPIERQGIFILKDEKDNIYQLIISIKERGLVYAYFKKIDDG